MTERVNNQDLNQYKDELELVIKDTIKENILKLSLN